MSAEVSVEEIAHIASLCRLELSEEERALYATQLSSVLGHIETIRRLDTNGVEPMTHAVFLSNVLREDVIGPSLDRAEVLGQAPDVEEDRFRVPRILGEAP